MSTSISGGGFRRLAASATNSDILQRERTVCSAEFQCTHFGENSCCELARTVAVQLPSQLLLAWLAQRDTSCCDRSFAARLSAIATSCIDPGSALTYCVVLRRDILRQCSLSVLVSVYSSVVFGIRQYILVFSLISSNFISVLFIVDCRFGIREFLIPCPLRKSAIYL